MRLRAIVVCLLVVSWQTYLDKITVAAQQEFGDAAEEGKYGEVGQEHHVKYDVKKTGFGSSVEEALEEYGVILNQFDTYGEHILQSNKLIFVYIMNSEKVDEGSLATRLNYDVIGPVIRDMRGLIDVIIFDCMHPLVTIQKMGWASVCKTDTNPHGMPNLQKIIPPQLKKNPYTGEPMQKAAT